MDSKVENTRWIEDKFLSTEIHNCLMKHDARDFDYLHEHVRARAEIVWFRHQQFVSINADDGSRVALDTYVADLKRRPKFAMKFNRVPKISRADQAAINENMAKIAAGEVQVVDEVEVLDDDEMGLQ